LRSRGGCGRGGIALPSAFQALDSTAMQPLQHGGDPHEAIAVGKPPKEHLSGRHGAHVPPSSNGTVAMPVDAARASNSARNAPTPGAALALAWATDTKAAADAGKPCSGLLHRSRHCGDLAHIAGTQARTTHTRKTAVASHNARMKHKDTWPSGGKARLQLAGSSYVGHTEQAYVIGRFDRGTHTARRRRHTSRRRTRLLAGAASRQGRSGEGWRRTPLPAAWTGRRCGCPPAVHT
jgi:hypothetical protein